VTPVIFEKVGSNLVVRGVGKSRYTTTSGIYTFDFDVQSGSASLANSNYTHGHFDRNINNSSGTLNTATNGSIGFGGGSTWGWTGSFTDANIGTSYSVNNDTRIYASELILASTPSNVSETDNAVTWTESTGTTGNAKTNAAISLFAASVLVDNDNTKASKVVIDLKGIRDGNSEVLSIGGATVLLGTSYSNSAAGSIFKFNYNPTARQLTILPATGAIADVSAIQTLLRTITYNNTSSRPTDNRSLSFDGLDDVVTIADSSALDLTGNLSVEAWLKPTAVSTEQVILEKADAYSLAILAGGELGYKLGTDASWTHSGLTLTAGSWSHVALVSDGSTISVHLNGSGGSLSNSTSRAVSLSASSSSLLLGKGASSSGIAGGLADVRIWATARTQSDIAANYRSTSLASETNLVGYWDLREASGSVANDRSASANSGQLSGFTATTRTSDSPEGVKRFDVTLTAA